jgi:hypothetical protein
VIKKREPGVGDVGELRKCFFFRLVNILHVEGRAAYGLFLGNATQMYAWLFSPRVLYGLPLSMCMHVSFLRLHVPTLCDTFGALRP